METKHIKQVTQLASFSYVSFLAGKYL